MSIVFHFMFSYFIKSISPATRKHSFHWSEFWQRLKMWNCLLGWVLWMGIFLYIKRLINVFCILPRPNVSSKFPTRCQYNLQCHRVFHLYTSKSKAKHLQLASAFVIHIFISVTDTFLLYTKLLSSFPWMPNWYHKNIVVHSSRTLVAEVPSEEQFVTVTACSLSSQVGNEFCCWWNNVGKPTAWLERDEFIENFCFTLTWIIMKSCTCFALSNWEPQLPLCQPQANMEMHFIFILSPATHPTLLASPTMLSFLHPLTFNDLQGLLQCSTSATKEKTSPLFSISSHIASCFREGLSLPNGADREPFWSAQPSHCFSCL